MFLLLGMVPIGMLTETVRSRKPSITKAIVKLILEEVSSNETVKQVLTEHLTL